MKYSEIDIKNAVGALTFTKGKEYFRSGMVIECNTKTDNDALTNLYAKSHGSSGYTYSQNIQLYKTFGKLKLHGTCTCPVGFNCKHVVATILHHLHSPKLVDPLAQMKQWIESIEHTVQESISEPSKPKSEYFLVYRIYDPDKMKGYGHLQVYKARLGKNGKLLKGSMCSLQNVLHSANYYDILEPNEWVILGMCQGLFNRWNNTLTFAGELGYRALRALIESGRCYHAQSDVPLSWSDEPFSLNYQWVNEDLEHSKLISNLVEGYQLTSTQPIIMIDTVNNTLHKTDTTLPFETIMQLHKSPIIPTKYIETVHESLSLLAPISAPLGYSCELLDVEPRGEITLVRGNDSSLAFHHIELRALYGAYVLDLQPFTEKSYVKEGQTRIEILRRKSSEYALVQTLCDHGFLSHDKNKKILLAPDYSSGNQAALRLWSDFLHLHLPSLQESGWSVRYADDFVLRFDESAEISVASEEKNDWFSLSFDLNLGGATYPLVPLLSTIIQEFDDYASLPPKINVEIAENHYVSIDTQEMEPILKTIFELYSKKSEDGTIKIGKYESHLLSDMDDNVVWKGSREVLELSHKLKDFKNISHLNVPTSLQASLREYQHEGLDWLGFLREFRFGGILADDMGLGKTIQTLTHLCRLKESGELSKPCLIIMPTSLIANWRNEANRFTPSLSVLILHGTNRHDVFDKIDEYDLILTTYPLIVRDKERLESILFDTIILDEAQKIKNPRTQMAQSIKLLKSNHRIALSGTPIENHLGELWSIFSFLMPGFLGNQSFFREYYQTPIEKERNMTRQEQLNRRIQPFVLRRTKEGVVQELPAKSVIIKYVQFGSKQAKLYESIRVTMEERVREAISAKGLGKSHIMILDALLKLRQVCCDPSLLSLEEAKKVKESAKLELLMDMLEELLSEGRKILIFSQFTSMLSLIEAKLIEEKIRYTKLTGSTRKREEAISAFTDGNAEVFLISLKAGGVGLNLVEADTVIHYDPWWNPAVENQATDRAHRIGQTKAVFVYKLIVENSIEQKILELQKRKEAVQNAIYSGNSEEENIFNGEELIGLLQH